MEAVLKYTRNVLKSYQGTVKIENSIFANSIININQDLFSFVLSTVRIENCIFNDI